jgi:signal transduction histidine kinase
LKLANLTDARILIVDDQEANLRVLAAVLEFAGYRNVRCLDDSRQVLRLFADFRPDLIVLDLHMPHLDGLAVLDQLAQVIDEEDYLPVLVLTGDATTEAKERALSHGANDFLSKPLNQTEVHLRVKNLLQTRHLHLQLKDQNLALEQRVEERTQLAEELRRAMETAESANQTKSEFLSRMSHELRTPLNSILGFAQLLELEDLSPEPSDNVQHILRGGRHLLELINEVLDLARIEAGRLSLSPEPVRVREALKDALDVVRPLADKQNVHIGPDVGLRCNRHVRADRQRLKQVLLNLLANAVKFNRPGGSVTLSCEEVSTNRLRIEVADTGLGISPEGLAKLFKPFERLEADQAGISGTGLGLALSKRLVEAMGGVISAESNVGEGSRFFIELELVEHPADRTAIEGIPAVPAARSNQASHHGTVLYIEDNLSNLRLMERILAHYPGVKLLAAMQGELGLDLARVHTPDWILLDVHLPDLGGEEVLRRLRKDPRTQEIPVTVVSADATPGQIRRLTEAGARDYLTKPLDVKQLLRLLEQTMHHEVAPAK